ncbi:septum formation family protein [Pseudarthrobacter sp. NPDC058119]|uniref:septum formation family protein n=1 Tax=Pseudarthrobacter sp. NPDC058119 TaxID=3346348 RepID=UPI0036DF5309
MNHQDVPPKPALPPRTGNLPTVPGRDAGPAPAPESVTWSQPRREPEPDQGANRRPAFWKAFLIVVIVAVAGSLVWLAVWLNSSPGTDSAKSSDPGVLQTAVTPPATPQPLPRDGVAPADYAVGDCFKDFDPQALSSTLVPCDTGHSAQLVATLHYPESTKYPGAEPLKAKALEVCQASKLGPAAKQFQLNYQRSFPSNTSWESGDRRVDCYVTADTGNVVTASVLP